MEVTSITKRQKRSSSKVKCEDNACVFLRQHHEFVPERPSVTESLWVFWNAYGRVFAVSGPSTQHQAVGFFFTTMRRFTGQLLYNNFSPKTRVRAQSSAYSHDLSPVTIFFSPNWSYHWKGASLKTLKTSKEKTSKELWHRVFGSYYKKTCRVRSSLC
jgi:hypothetical protein